MELTEQLRADGTAKGLCRQWQMKLHKGLSMAQLVKLYIEGIDFCISEDFPTLAFLREHFKGACEPFGVFVDDDIPQALNVPDMVLNGACRAMLEYDGYSVSRLYVRHTSEAAVAVSGHAVLTIDLFNDAKLHISVVGDKATVNINVYGDKADVQCVWEDTPQKVNIKYNPKTTY